MIRSPLATWTFGDPHITDGKAEGRLVLLYSLLRTEPPITNEQSLTSIAIHTFLAQQSEKIVSLTTAAGVPVEPIWATLLAKALEGKDVKELLTNVGGGGAAVAVAAPAAAGGAGAAEEAKEEKKEEEKEESVSNSKFQITAWLKLRLGSACHAFFPPLTPIFHIFSPSLTQSSYDFATMFPLDLLHRLVANFSRMTTWVLVFLTKRFAAFLSFFLVQKAGFCIFAEFHAPPAIIHQRLCLQCVPLKFLLLDSPDLHQCAASCPRQLSP